MNVRFPPIADIPKVRSWAADLIHFELPRPVMDRRNHDWSGRDVASRRLAGIRHFAKAS